MMKGPYRGKWLLLLLVPVGIWGAGAAAVHDGEGTSHVGALSATSIALGGDQRAQWPARNASAGGGPFDFRTHSNQVFWTSAVLSSGLLKNVKVQVDQGTAAINIVRAKWTDAWGTYSVVGGFEADGSGATFTNWTSAWVSNDYRLGVVVTNFTTGTNLWWSIEYSR